MKYIHELRSTFKDLSKILNLSKVNFVLPTFKQHWSGFSLLGIWAGIPFPQQRKCFAVVPFSFPNLKRLEVNLQRLLSSLYQRSVAKNDRNLSFIKVK